MARDDFELDAAMHPHLRRILQGLIALAVLAVLGGAGLHGWHWWQAHEADRLATEAHRAERAELFTALQEDAPKLEARMEELTRQIDALEATLAAAPAPTGTANQAAQAKAYRLTALGQFSTAAGLSAEMERLAGQASRALAGLGTTPEPEAMALGTQLVRLTVLQHRQAALNARFATVQQNLGALEADRHAARERIKNIAAASHIDYAKGKTPGKHYYSGNGKVMYPRFNGTGAHPMYEQTEAQR